MPSAPSVTLELRDSRIERRVAGALLSVSIVSLLLASWPIAVRVAAAFVLAGVALVVARRRARVGRIARVEWAVDGSWRLHPASASTQTPAAAGSPDAAIAMRLREHHVAGQVIALRFCKAETGGRFGRWSGRRTLVLWPDSADADALRRLRIRLARLQPDEQGSRSLDGVG
jgi:toxin CptA